MTDLLADFDTARQHQEAIKAGYAAWARDNCGAKSGGSPSNPTVDSELGKWVKFRTQILAGTRPVPPTMVTETGQALVAVGVLYLDATIAPEPPPPPPPPGAAPIWNGDLSTGNLSQWGGVEYVGQPTMSPPVSSRVAVGSSLSGVTPPPGVKNLMQLTVRPGDQYFSTTGWRTLLRQYEPLRTAPQGHDSWYVFAIYAPSGYPADANMWVAPLEVHQTKASYVSVTGVAPAHLIAKADGLHVDVAGGRDGNRVVAVNQVVPFAQGAWNVYAMRYRHDLSPNGAFELWKDGAPLIQKTGVATMYEGTSNYLEWGLYRAQSGTSTTTLYLAGVREYQAKADALAYAATLT